MLVAPYLVQEPHQERSRETMARIMDAAALILESRTFEQLTVAEIVKMAGTSVGAFYGRFRDKDGLLQALDERFFDEFESCIDALLMPSHWKDASIADMIRDMTQMLVDIYDRNTGVLRSLNLAARLSGDPRFKEREHRAWEELFPRFQRVLLSRSAWIQHPDPEMATRFGFQQLFFTMRELILWNPLRNDVPYKHDIMVAELTRGFLGYLEVEESFTAKEDSQ